MKRIIFFGIIALLYIHMISLSHATVIRIGSVNYDSADRDLVWYTDTSGRSLVWLDYRNSQGSQSSQTDWAEGLNTVLQPSDYNYLAGYSVTWNGGWRLPNVFSSASSEIGLLHVDYLADSTILDSFKIDSFPPNSRYWTSTPTGLSTYNYYAYYTHNTRANTSTNHHGLDNGNNFWGMAVRTATVSYSQQNQIPEPATMLLFGIGLTGLAGISRGRGYQDPPSLMRSN